MERGDFSRSRPRPAEARPGSGTGGSRRVAIGKAAEEAAAVYLERSGLRIVERNWRCRRGEVDLIGIDGDTLVFVEVRSRTNPANFGTAIEAVSPRKCRQVRDVAAVYLHLRRHGDKDVRFDAIAVTFGPDGGIAELNHLPGAF